MKPGSVQMIVLHGQMFAMFVGKGLTLQLTFSVVIIGARESRIKFASGVGTQSATRIVWICFLFMSCRKTRTV